jgi:hypothetical protein
LPLRNTMVSAAADEDTTKSNSSAAGVAMRTLRS